LIDFRPRGDGAAVLAVHATVLAFGLALAVPILAHHPQAVVVAKVWARPALDRGGIPDSPMAFEQPGSAQAEEGPIGSVESLPAAPHARPARAAAALAAPPTPPAGSGVGVQAIYAVFGQSPGLAWALRVAHCESRYDPLAVNGASGASGLFQFMPSTWNAHFAGWNIWDPYAQARAALAFYSQGATNAWTCK